MRLLLILLVALAPSIAPAQAPAFAAPDFTVLVRDAGAAVVALSGGQSLVLPDVPLAEDALEDEEDEEDPGLLREFLRRFYGPAVDVRSLGSGFVIDAAGYIITNAHLVAERRDIKVRLADRREFEAQVIGVDALSDIALIKIEAGGLAPVRIGDPAKLRPGEWVAAIGSPFGFERSVTAGIVSAVNRTLPEESFVPFIQTDVAVNPGNSGGPLFNLHGEVVGVNSMIYSDTGSYTGVSFAIPIDVAMDVARQLRASGKVTRGRIGVRLQELTAELARAFRLPDTSGAAVVEVFRRSPAERAALQAGDVIVRFAGKPVDNDADLVRLTAAALPGSTVEVELVRFGVPQLARVTIDEARAPVMPPALAVPAHEPLGLQLAPLERKLRERLQIEGGVRVERARDASQRAGLMRGDIILSVNGRPVSSADGFRALLAAAGKGTMVALLIQRDSNRHFLPLRVPR
jgi:serine protease Do